MFLPRFFCDHALKTHSTITLPSQVAQHAGKSLRLKSGDEIILFNGLGGEYLAELQFIDGQAQAQIKQFNDINRMPSAQLAIAQALPSGDKMDWIVEKNSELGISEIIPLQADRSIVKLAGNRLEKKLQRWQKISISSAEQCGRNLPLKIQSLNTLKQFLEEHPYDTLLVCHPEAEDNLHQHLLNCPPAGTICILIGPEGGWSETELQLMQKHSQAFKWGERIFRTETAGLILCSAIMGMQAWF